MGRRAPGLFKRLMPLDDVKGAAVAQGERDGMAGGQRALFIYLFILILAMRVSTSVLT